MKAEHILKGLRMSQAQNEALRKLAEKITPEDAEKLLESLRWHEDMVVTNHEGDRVWLKLFFDESGKQCGITDCCPEAWPCERHKAMQKPNGDLITALKQTLEDYGFTLVEKGK